MKILEGDLLHPGEDELVQLIDGELSEDVHARISEHIGECSACREKLDELEGISGWLRSNIDQLDKGAEIDEIARARALAAARTAERKQRAEASSKQNWSRVAAAIVLLIAGGFAVSPVRAWLLELREAEIVEAPLPLAPVQALPAAEEGATLSFRPVTASFSIALASSQTAGSVIVGVSGNGQASAQVIGGSDESVMILPSGLLVENRPESTASYRILLPASLIRQFEVTAGGETLLRNELENNGTAETILNLAGATAAQ